MKLQFFGGDQIVYNMLSVIYLTPLVLIPEGFNSIGHITLCSVLVYTKDLVTAH